LQGLLKDLQGFFRFALLQLCSFFSRKYERIFAFSIDNYEISWYNPNQAMRKFQKKEKTMSIDWMNVKEEAILFAKEKVSDASDAIEEILPETAEELDWIETILAKELLGIRMQRSEQVSLSAPKGGAI
jgi:hypothetical protein